MVGDIEMQPLGAHKSSSALSSMKTAPPENHLLHDSDEPLLPSVASGDRLAVNRCIRRYGPLVWSIARRLSPTPSDAEDAVQEIFLDIWRSADRFDRSRGSEKVFVTMLARRTLIDRLRNLRPRLRAETHIDEESEREGPATGRAERHAEVEEARQLLERLPLPQQRVIALSLVQGMSHAEISDSTGLPLGTVKTLLRRGIVRVRELLSERGSHER
jgi:RNA polymerase sigma-70 factor (ECF subfamily)